MKRIVRMIIFWTLLASLAALIFYFSSQPSYNSSQVSLPFRDRLIKILSVFGINTLDEAEFLHGIVRKTAHFTLYFTFGVLSCLAVFETFSNRKIPAMLLCADISVLYAISDEVHQFFVIGRAMQLTDIILDSVAAIIGILIIKLFFNIKEKYKNGKV